MRALIQIAPSGALAANYDISFVSGTLTVDKAIFNRHAANDDAKFLTQPDPATFQGVSYSGFKYGQVSTDPGVIGGTLSPASSRILRPILLVSDGAVPALVPFWTQFFRL